MSAKKKKNTKQYSVHIDPDLHRRVRVEAARRGCQISDVFDDALRAHFRPRKGAK